MGRRGSQPAFRIVGISQLGKCGNDGCMDRPNFSQDRVLHGNSNMEEVELRKCATWIIR